MGDYLHKFSLALDVSDKQVEEGNFALPLDVLLSKTWHSFVLLWELCLLALCPELYGGTLYDIHRKASKHNLLQFL